MHATAHIKDIRCRTIIGAYDWERGVKQDIIINVFVEYNAAKVIESDNLEDTLNYCDLSERIVEQVESTDFFILEKLVSFVLDITMNNPKAQKATVEIAKLAPLRKFAESVSVKASRERQAS